MPPTNPPMSVKSSTSVIHPNTTNESLILLSTQMDSIRESLESIRKDYGEMKEDIKDIYDKMSALEVRMSIEERDKKILIGIIVVVIPLALTIIQMIFN